MILRRISDAIREQNWFMVGIDFIIVLFGIWGALLVTEWADTQQKQANLLRAEQDINNEIAWTYFIAHERLSLVTCRQARYRDLLTLLRDPDEDWPGTPGPYGDGMQTSYRVAPPVLRSPSRSWYTQAWDAAFANGTLDIMDAGKRLTFLNHFEQTKEMERLQIDVSLFESRFQALAYPMKISASDKLRYYELLSELDMMSAAMELESKQIIDRIETNNLLANYDFTDQIDLSLTDQNDLSFGDWVKERNTRRKEVYGECTKPVDLAVLKATDGGTP